jgi:uncharacterized protein (TIGR02266 family)
MTKESERRGFTRVPLKVKMFVNEGEGEGLLYFYTSNISAGGIFIISDLLLESETTLQVEFNIPSNEGGIIQIRVNGIVRWQQNVSDSETAFTPPGMGIQFVDLDPYHRKVIETYVTQNIDRAID